MFGLEPNIATRQSLGMTKLSGDSGVLGDGRVKPDHDDFGTARPHFCPWKETHFLQAVAGVI
jgi:hypothetical protein